MKSKEMSTTQKEPVIGLVIGLVSGCVNLRVRKGPDDKTEVLGTIPIDTEVKIDESEFYKVYTDSGLEGFCLKKFITV